MVDMETKRETKRRMLWRNSTPQARAALGTGREEKLRSGPLDTPPKMKVVIMFVEVKVTDEVDDDIIEIEWVKNATRREARTSRFPLWL